MSNLPLTSYSMMKSSKIRNKTRIFTLTTFIQYSFGSPNHGNHRRKWNNGNLNWKRSETVTVCRWHDRWLYIENPKDATTKLLELINVFTLSCRIQNNTKTCCISIHHEQNIIKRNWRNNSTYHCIKSKIPGNKPT